MNSKRAFTYGGIILANLFWSLSFVGYKVAYKYFEPMALIFFRMVLSAAFLYLVIRLTGRVEKIRSEDKGRFLILALLEPLLYFLGESYGMKLVSSTTGAVIVSTIPLLTPIAAWFFLKEKVGWIKLAGIFISFSGVCFVLIGRRFTLNAPPLGILLMFVAVISAVLYTGVISYLAGRYKSQTIILMQSFLGAIYFLPIFLLTDLKETLAIQPSWEAFLPLLFLAIFPSSISFILYTQSIREIGITRTNVFANFIPVFTAIFSYFILRETFTAAKIIGIPLVLAGLFLAQIRIRKRSVQ